MSHLGDVLSALVDGQLAPPEAERVLAHVAGCEPCADALRAAPATPAALCGPAASSDLAPDAGLTARLLALGAAAPVGQRPTHTAPGAGSLPLPGSGGRLGTLSGDLRPRRRPVVPVVAAVAGVGLLTACFTLGAEPDVAVEAQPGTVLQVLNAAAAAPVAPDRAELEAWFDDNPWWGWSWSAGPEAGWQRWPRPPRSAAGRSGRSATTPPTSPGSRVTP